jgi:hypothetical protein
MAILSAHLDFARSQLPSSALMVDRSEPELQRLKTGYCKADGTPMTIHAVGMRHGQSVGLPQFVGTASGVADHMETFIDRSAAMRANTATRTADERAAVHTGPGRSLIKPVTIKPIAPVRPITRAYCQPSTR